MANSFDDYLAHYGVLGMKWGQRRYQNSDGSLTAAGKRHYEQTGEYGYTYKSHSTKKYARKAEKALAKSAAYAKKHGLGAEEAKNNKYLNKQANKYAKFSHRQKRSAELDAREQEYAQRVRASGNIAMRLLTKTIGGKAYQQHLAMNKDTTSLGSKVSASLLNYIGGRPLSMARKALYLRQDDRAAKRAAKGKAVNRGTAFRERAAAAKATFEQSINKAGNSVKSAYEKNHERERHRG